MIFYSGIWSSCSMGPLSLRIAGVGQELSEVLTILDMQRHAEHD